MWDTIETATKDTVHLSHDLPCPWCGHVGHLYLPCDADCGCTSQAMPGAYEVASAR